MDNTNFVTVRDLIKTLQSMPQDHAVAVQTVDNTMHPVYPEVETDPSVYVEGYGVDFVTLQIDIQFHLESTRA